MTTTAYDLIRDAMLLLKVANPDTLTASEISDGLRRLNAMMLSWANNPLNIYRVVSEDVVTTGSRVMTMGTGGDWNTDRPMKITQATARIASGLDRPITILPAEDYAKIRMKSLETNYPQYMYFDGNFPLQNVAIWPVPSQGMTLTLWSIKPLATFANSESVATFPPGYEDAITYNLAVRMAPMFQIDAGAEITRIAVTSLKQIQRTNTRVPTMQSDPALLSRRGGQYNVYSDGWGPGQ